MADAFAAFCERFEREIRTQVAGVEMRISTGRDRSHYWFGGGDVTVSFLLSEQQVTMHVNRTVAPEFRDDYTVPVGSTADNLALRSVVNVVFGDQVHYLLGQRATSYVSQTAERAVYRVDDAVDVVLDCAHERSIALSIGGRRVDVGRGAGAVDNVVAEVLRGDDARDWNPLSFRQALRRIEERLDRLEQTVYRGVDGGD